MQQKPTQLQRVSELTAARTGPELDYCNIDLGSAAPRTSG